jgi:hypothetical protein
MDPLRVAEKAVVWLAGVPGVDGIMVFGSVARGDADVRSDIDVLVVSRDADLGPAAVRAHLPRRLRRSRLAFTCVQPHRLRWMWQRGDVLAHHLFAEGQVLFDRDGALTALMTAEPQRSANLPTQLAAVRAQLRAFDDLAVFRGELLFALSSIYALTKGVILADLVDNGATSFNRQAAFEIFSAKHPTLADDIRTLAELEPFYATVTRRQPAAAALAADDLESTARCAVLALQRLCTQLQGHDSHEEGPP